MIMLIYPLGDTGGAERFGTGNARIKNFLRFLLSIFDPCSSTSDRTNRPIRNFAARGIACVAFSPSSSPVEKPCNSIISTDTHRSIHGVSIRNAFSTKDPSSSSPPPPPRSISRSISTRLERATGNWIGAGIYLSMPRLAATFAAESNLLRRVFEGRRGWMVIRSSFRGENSRRRGGREGHGMNL